MIPYSRRVSYYAQATKEKFSWVFLAVQLSADDAESFKEKMYERLKPLYNAGVINRGITSKGDYFILFRLESDLNDFSRRDLDFGKISQDRRLADIGDPTILEELIKEVNIGNI